MGAVRDQGAKDVKACPKKPSSSLFLDKKALKSKGISWGSTCEIGCDGHETSKPGIRQKALLKPLRQLAISEEARVLWPYKAFGRKAQAKAVPRS